MKVSINLPNQVAITIESNQTDQADQVIDALRVALKELSSDLVQQNPPATQMPADQDHQAPHAQRPSSVVKPSYIGDRPTVFSVDESAKEQFVEFCRQMGPIGDMRRIVVAAYGASIHLELNSVSSRELYTLFDMAGWLQPKDFVQCLRNAARSKFRWLERIPGRSGYYITTEKGTTTVMASSKA